MTIPDDLKIVRQALESADYCWTEGPGHEALYREFALDALDRIAAQLFLDAERSDFVASTASSPASVGSDGEETTG